MLTRLGLDVELAFLQDLAAGTFLAECLSRHELGLVLEVARRYRDLKLGVIGRDGYSPSTSPPFAPWRHSRAGRSRCCQRTCNHDRDSGRWLAGQNDVRVRGRAKQDGEV